MLKASKHEAGPEIRSHPRAVADYDVDRPQVQAWRHAQPSGTNSPETPEKDSPRAAAEAEGHGGRPRKYRVRRPGHGTCQRDAVVASRIAFRFRKSSFGDTTPRADGAGAARGGPEGRVPEKEKTKAGTARGFHLFPSRTEKLNPAAPMVLRKRESR